MNRKPPISPAVTISLLLSLAATGFVIASGFVFLIFKSVQP